MGKTVKPKKGAVKRPPTSKVSKTASKRKKPTPKAKAPKATRKASKAARKGWETRRQREAQASKAARKGWETRRQREAQTVAQRQLRADAARRGWQKRHTKALEKEGLNPRSAELLGELSATQQQLLHNMRLAVMGPMGYSEDLTGRNPGGLEVLRNMVQHRDKRWETFTQYAQQAGFSSQQARTAFFSPSVKRMSQARAPGLRP
jgi:hypothetical protein